MSFNVQSSLIESLNGYDRLLWILVDHEGSPQAITLNGQLGMVSFDSPEAVLEYADWNDYSIVELSYETVMVAAEAYEWDTIWVMDNDEIFSLPVEAMIS